MAEYGTPAWYAEVNAAAGHRPGMTPQAPDAELADLAAAIQQGRRVERDDDGLTLVIERTDLEPEAS